MSSGRYHQRFGVFRRQIVLGAGCLLAAFAMGSGNVVNAQRGAWMWSTATHPFGAANVLGDVAKEAELISYFGAWGYDRVYASVGDKPITDPDSIARWNSTLNSFGLESQSLYGLVSFSPSSLVNLVQTRVIAFNDLREDSSEHFDAVHLDVEPHGSNAWNIGSATDKRDLLYLLRDSYAAIRSQLDNSGYPEVKIYADLPVWFDSTLSIGWTRGERIQWFEDIASHLDGITLMAFERSTLSAIQSGVAWEVANFDGDVRIGLNVNEIGPGNTFADFDAMLNLADEIETSYGAQISGVDFQPLTSYADLAGTPVFDADFDGDSDVEGRDFLIWQRGVGVSDGAISGQGDANGSGSVNLFDLEIWREQYGMTHGSTMAVVPESSTLTGLLMAVGLGTVVRGNLLMPLYTHCARRR